MSSEPAGGGSVPRLLLLDNYDSFTFNLAHDFEALGAAVEVQLNDRIEVAEILDRDFDAVVISPGPGRPEQAGITPRLVRAAAGRVPLLGVCLGHQAIAEAHGARIVRARAPMHGKTSWVEHEGRGLFRGLPNPFRAGRYHSLVVEPGTLGCDLRVTARAEDGTIMALRHRRWPVYGVQFHPESVLTDAGKPLLRNFLCCVRRFRSGSRAA